jgi:UDP-glucuronate 4-epimerase
LEEQKTGELRVVFGSDNAPISSRPWTFVTGGLGFIGSHLVESLLGDGVPVLALDNLDKSTYNPMLRLENLSILSKLARSKGTAFRFILGDTHNRPLIKTIFSANAVGCIVDLAARAGVRPSLLDPVGYIQANVEGFVSLLAEAKEAGVRKVVYVSSSSVYGNKPGRFFEDDPELNPGSPYGMSKLMAERFFALYARLYGLSGIVLRPFTVYGPRQRPEMAIHKFLNQLLHDRPLTIFGDGSMRRDFTHVLDVVAGIRGAIELSIQPGVVQTYNLGTSHPVSLFALIEALEEATNKKADVRLVPAPPGELFQTWADIKKAREQFGYCPKVGLKEGLSDFVRWYNKRVNP